ncbi:MAG: leucyl/phenylalanyl-tRNA--protein transferase [Sedimenticola sp.]|nr:leucyl/phenylalanyl-tRNA--protein transferase [Sedimenticola sp.]
MISLLDPDNPNEPFPPVEQAEVDPDGLLAVGGDLCPSRLLNAYRQGIFPWYSDDQPILWWSPDPRTVLFPGDVKVSKSLRKAMRRQEYRFSFDQDFPRVIAGCAMPQPGREETWITEHMKNAYIELHRMGYAHSAEIWEQNRLVGGLYGVAIGRAFFGESMFSLVPNASKIALVHLARALEERGFGLIDCQVYTPHLISMGATEISRRQFIGLLDRLCDLPDDNGIWKEETL